ncbi:MAG: hypothetical protein Q8927_17415 [Bacteroidota bacterium]|nr:hypothetical protein [Bacteroidota bacterium]
MVYDQQGSDPQSLFHKTLLTGVFVGFIDTIICLFYNIWYRGSVGYFPADIINVSSLIFIINAAFVVVGVVYFGFRKAFAKGDIPYSLVFALLTAFLVWKVSGVHRSDDEVINAHFKVLLTGIILILGITATIAVPMLFHNKTFDKEVL